MSDTTHHASCYHDHHACAVAEVERLRAELADQGETVPSLERDKSMRLTSSCDREVREMIAGMRKRIVDDGEPAASGDNKLPFDAAVWLLDERDFLLRHVAELRTMVAADGKRNMRIIEERADLVDERNRLRAELADARHRATILDRGELVAWLRSAIEVGSRSYYCMPPALRALLDETTGAAR